MRGQEWFCRGRHAAWLQQPFQVMTAASPTTSRPRWKEIAVDVLILADLPGHGTGRSSAGGPLAGRGPDSNQSVAYNAASGELLVVWEDTRGGDYDLYAQRVDENDPLGKEIAVRVGAGDQSAPDLAAGAQGYLVVLQQGPDGERDV